MKNSHRLLFILVTILALFCGRLAIGQPSATINYDFSNLAPGTNIEVPIVINGSGIGIYQFLINYDRDVLTYQSFTNVAGSSFLAVNNNFVNVNLPGPFLRINDLKASPGFSFSNQVVLKLNFTYNGGYTDLSFYNIATATNNTATYYSYITTFPGGSTGTINLGSVFTGGTVSGAPAGILHSVLNGGDWNTASTWVENIVPSAKYSVVIQGDLVTVNPSSNLAKCYDLTINSVGKLTLNSGKSISLGNVFTIESGGSFVDKNITTNLSAIAKRNITGNYPGSGLPTASTIWHYISSPVSNGTIGIFAGCLMNEWVENNQGGTWRPLALPLSYPMEVGRGYSVAATPTFGTAVFNGPLNTGNVTRSGLSFSNPTPGTYDDSYGWHLLGNPYASAFKWDAAVSRTNVDAAIYLWNGSTYLTKLPADNYEVQAEQAFFVHASATGGQVVFPNANRVHSSGAFLKTSSMENLVLTVDGNNFSDETSIRFNELATSVFDNEYDAYKLFGVNTAPQIFSILPDLNLSINSLPQNSTQSVIPVGFKSGLAGTFTLTATGLESFTPGTTFYLTDLFTGHVQNLNANPVYTFSATPANPEHRFNLQFSPVGFDESSLGSTVKCYSVGKTILVAGIADMQGKIVVFDMLGRELQTKSIESGSLNRIELNASQGYYLVQVVTEKASITQKVFIR